MVPMAAKVQEVGRWHPDLLDGEYVLLAGGAQDDTVSVTAPFAVSVTPSQLVRI